MVQSTPVLAWNATTYPVPEAAIDGLVPVSYTHLTLPTSDLV